MVSFHRACTVAAAAAVLLACFIPGRALAATPSADLATYVYANAAGDDPTTAAVGADALFEVYVYNYGPDAVAAHVAITVTGASITAVSAEDFDIGAACSVTTATTATCTTDSLPGDGETSTIDLHTTATVAGTITATADVSSTATDPDPSDNSGNAQITAVVPPPTSLTATTSYDTDSGIGFTLDIDAHLTFTGSGDDVDYSEIDISYRFAGSSTWQDGGTTYTDDTGHAMVSMGQLASGDLDVRLVHPGTAQAAGVTTTVHVVAPATTLSATVAPTAVNRLGSVKVRAALSLTGSGKPIAGSLLTLERRPTGASAWHTVTTDYTDAKGALSLSDSPSQPSDYRFVHASEIGAGASVSSVVSVAISPSLHETLSPAIEPPGYHSVLSAQEAPRVAGGTADLQQLKAGKWVTIHRKSVPATGLVSWTIQAPKKGVFSYRVAVQPGLNYVAKVGKTLVLKVTTQGLGSRSAYTFLQVYNGHPMRWNPCRAIGYKVDPRLGPTGSLAMVKETLRRIHIASGLSFHYEGRTKSHAVWGVIRHQPAPLIISWVTPKNSNGLFGYGNEVGYGGATESTYRDGRDVIEQGGVILLDKSDPRTRGIAPGFGAGVTWGQLLMHELGHAMGLNHTNGKWQIMQPILEPLPAAMYGAGDLHGLHLLGRSQGCLP